MYGTDISMTRHLSKVSLPYIWSIITALMRCDIVQALWTFLIIKLEMSEYFNNLVWVVASCELFQLLIAIRLQNPDRQNSLYLYFIMRNFRKTKSNEKLSLFFLINVGICNIVNCFGFSLIKSFLLTRLTNLVKGVVHLFVLLLIYLRL